MTHVEEAQDTGTACLGLNTWQQGATLPQKLVRYGPPFVC